MSKLIAVLAGTTVVVALGTTFAITQFVPVPDCGATVGGDIGGSFTLRSETGVIVTDRDVIVEPTLIYFGYTFCPDVCPLDNARNAAAIDILADQGLSATPVFISIDPDRDSVDVVRDYADNFHPKMIGLTGTGAQVAVVSQAYRTFYQKEDGDPEYYLIAHSTSTYLALPESGVAAIFGRDDSAEHVAQVAACMITG
ncbi:SCO family protein [Loktanella sp. D2R18]|uniref:SCO family protein n=1 Tax=Rhodobacterales TaxID=204455 RepID=UPI000DE89AD7|nr:MULTISPECIES: SCO family protein [Rhodobacterales]MDO6590485.1 SCO family protein [Yoonia sp. 1_MG-2023]RBW41204.1 SCO family protein [Loktanella sp. D2R18]